MRKSLNLSRELVNNKCDAKVLLRHHSLSLSWKQLEGKAICISTRKKVGPHRDDCTKLSIQAPKRWAITWADLGHIFRPSPAPRCGHTLLTCPTVPAVVSGSLLLENTSTLFPLPVRKAFSLQLSSLGGWDHFPRLPKLILNSTSGPDPLRSSRKNPT